MDRILKARLLDALTSTPRLLLLGQRFLARSDADNPIFTSLREEIGSANYYDWWLTTTTGLEEKAGLLDARTRAVVIDERFDVIQRLSWLAVYSSSIDPLARRLLEVQGKRQVTELFLPADRLSIASLTLMRLFGSVARQDIAEMPPSDRAALRQRRTRAQEMLLPLADFVTPTGRLFVEGWHPNDWLRPRDLAPSLAMLGPGQVLLFGLGASDQRELEQEDDFAELITSGIVWTYSTSLVETLAELDREGLLHHVVDPRLIAPDTIAYRVVEHSPSSLGRPQEHQLETLVRA